jgi:adenylate cyclase
MRVVAVPLDPVLAPFNRITQALLVAGGLALVLSALVGLALSRGLTKPVHELVEATGRVARGDYEHDVTVTSQDEMGTLAQAFNQMTQDLRLKERARVVLNKVTSPEVARLLLRDEVKLGGENRPITVLFADIRGFSTLTEGMEPQKVIAVLNQCMERLSRIVDDEGGTVDKYIGDELMAFWGAPVGHGDHALRAVRAAVRMQEAMAELSRERVAVGEGPIRIGVGLNSGVAVAGLMGSPDRWNYTVLGEMVNLAARLCSGAAPGEVAVTSATLSETGDAVVARSLGARRFKGFTSDVEVFNVERVQTEPGGTP